jgi:phosphoribosylformylglycinamidine synthase
MATTTSEMAKPRALILSGFGINCERETDYAFEIARARPQIVHINDVIAQKSLIRECQILVYPGGFVNGDDTGSGLACANYLRDRLLEELLRFIESDRLSIGICNGFQIMSHLGMFPVGHDRYLTGDAVQTALTFNTSARYRDLWVKLSADPASKCVWTKGIGMLDLPVRHGEGRFYADDATMQKLRESGQVVFRYVNEDGSPAKGGPANPNGSLDDVAGICDPTGRHFGLMPHPEVAIHRTQDALYTLKRELAKRGGKDVPDETGCMRLFRNAVEYFK